MVGSTVTETAAQPAREGPSEIVLLRLATAYQASRALHVAARLGLADLLADAPRSAKDVAAATGTHSESLRRLLRTLVAFGVFAESEGGTFALGPLGECLRADVPASLRPLVLMYGHDEYWRCWGELKHCVRTGQTSAAHLFGPGDAFARYAADAALGAVMNAGLTALSTIVAQAIVKAYDFSKAERLVDVGGGQGQLLAAILQANLALQGTLFDLPTVVARASHLLAEAGVVDRCEVVGGDIFAGVPPGADLYLISRVVNSFDEERAVAVLKVCRAALTKPGARLLLAERLLPERVGPDLVLQETMLADLNMLVRTGGRNHSVEEFRAMLAKADLRLDCVIPTSGPVSLVEAVLR